MHWPMWSSCANIRNWRRRMFSFWGASTYSHMRRQPSTQRQNENQFPAWYVCPSVCNAATCACACVSVCVWEHKYTFVVLFVDFCYVLQRSLACFARELIAKVRLPIVCLRTRTRFPPRKMLLSWIICTAHNQNDYNFYDVFACGRTSAIS